MKKYFTFFSLFLFILFCTSVKSYAQWPRIYDSEKNRWTDFAAVSDAFEEAQIVFLGEKHDHKWGHLIEKHFLRIFHEVHGKNSVLALEMFERDVQPMMDGYLAKQVTEIFFRQNSRPWSNYSTDYKPLIEFSKNKNLPVLAMNIPRRYAAFISSGKEVDLFKMPKTELSFLPEKIFANEGPYKKKFWETMQGHVPPELIELYYRAQCAKDDTMARSILEHFAKKPETKIIAMNGSFHSDEKFGIPEKLLLKNPAMKIVVLSIIPVAEDKPINPADFKELADFVIFAPENEGILSDREVLISEFSN